MQPWNLSFSISFVCYHSGLHYIRWRDSKLAPMKSYFWGKCNNYGGESPMSSFLLCTVRGSNWLQFDLLLSVIHYCLDHYFFVLSIDWISYGSDVFHQSQLFLSVGFLIFQSKDGGTIVCVCLSRSRRLVARAGHSFVDGFADSSIVISWWESCPPFWGPP